MNEPVPLPDPRIQGTQDGWSMPDLFTADQLRAYGAACRSDERERIAQHFDSLDKHSGGYFQPRQPAHIIRNMEQP